MKVGDTLIKGNNEYMIIRLKPCFVTLISLRNGDSYDRKIHNVSDDNNITDDEMRDITGLKNWKSIFGAF